MPSCYSGTKDDLNKQYHWVLIKQLLVSFIQHQDMTITQRFCTEAQIDDSYFDNELEYDFCIVMDKETGLQSNGDLLAKK
jgi:hypothetical protein